MHDQVFHILFVCSGNSCRSPMAEGLLRAKLPDDLKDRISVKSAGTLGLDGNPATDFAIQVIRDLGVDISQHRSQGLTEYLANEADLIFALADNHKEYLDSFFPRTKGHVFLLRSFDRKTNAIVEENIKDPIGRSLPVYRECSQLIDSELDRILPRLEVLARQKMAK